MNVQTRLDSVERWCPNTNKWESVASLPVPLSSFCLVPCGGLLYAIGKIKPIFNLELIKIKAAFLRDQGLFLPFIVTIHLAISG